MSYAPPPNDDNLTPGPFGLLRNLSHELRTPLTAILGWTEWLAEHAGDPAQQQEGVQHIRSAAEKMLQLLDDYGDLARLSDEEESVTAATELPVAVRRICHGLELVAQQRGQSLRIVDEDRFPPVMLASMFRQGLWLAIRHALRAAPEGATIVVAYDLTAGRPQLSVGGSGGRENTDSGGLNLARRLITRAGGALTVEQAGTERRLLIQLPAAPPPVAAAASPASQAVERPNVAPAPAADTKKVLVIDDDENLLKLLGAVVSAAGYQPYLATSGAHGLEKARAMPPDVVLLDIGMPGMDGFATFNALRVEPRLAHAKIVALTAYTSTSERERIARHGFDGFIPKPFKREQLIQLLSELSV